jgi:energy-coupling factor transport system ATP-binding protein
LAEAGVWVPQVSELATSLAARGTPLEPFPLSVDEAASALHEASLIELGARLADGGEHPVFASAQHLSYRYPGSNHDALRDVSLEIRTGEVTAIVGANGAGKSTLARHFVRILRPPPGCMWLAGNDVSRLTAAEVARSVGYVFQYPEHQFIGRSVLDDVAFGLRRAGASPAEANRAAQALLEEFGLERVAQAHPFALSHGEQRRLSVAAMLALGQQGLFLDEPTFGQDRRNAYLLFRKMRSLADEGRAVVPITHDMRLVAEVAQRAIVMSAGRILFDGPPAVLFSHADLLSEAALRPPPITALGQRLGLSEPVLAVEQLARLLAPMEKMAVGSR